MITHREALPHDGEWRRRSLLWESSVRDGHLLRRVPGSWWVVIRTVMRVYSRYEWSR